jgi:serine/threonine-protein kinase
VVELATARRRLLVEGRNPFYVRSGYIVFARQSTLFAAPFDPALRELTGPVVRIVDGVQTDNANDTNFAVARDGTLVYVPEASLDRRLVWVDRKGRPRPLVDERRAFAHPRISPDGRRVVVSVPRESGGNEIWIYDVARGTRTRLSAAGPVSRPIWTPDGTRITFQREGKLYSVPADDSREPQPVRTRDGSSVGAYALAWSRDGRALVYSDPQPATGRDVWVLPVGGMPVPFLTTPRDERAAMFSPDGRWMVYAAKEAGREEEVYVQPYPGPGGRVVVSPGGGIEPVWSPTGREIFYRSVEGRRMMAVDVRTEPSFAVGTPRVLFEGRLEPFGGSYWSNYDVSPDGREFLMLEAVGSPTPRLNVVLNWIGRLTQAPDAHP